MWFDDSFRDLVCAVVKLTVSNTACTQCDWDLEGSDLRALVQSMLAERQRSDAESG